LLEFPFDPPLLRKINFATDLKYVEVIHALW
jgi:hypothetical protein